MTHTGDEGVCLSGLMEGRRQQWLHLNPCAILSDLSKILLKYALTFLNYTLDDR